MTKGLPESLDPLSSESGFGVGSDGGGTVSRATPFLPHWLPIWHAPAPGAGLSVISTDRPIP